MTNKKAMAIVASVALAACLGLTGCGGNQPAPESAASTSTTSSTVKSDSATPNSTATPTSSETPSATSSSATSTSPSAASYVGDQAAIDAALANAGFTTGDVTELEAELDLDDPAVHYDVSFKQGNTEYDYDIDATTGAILTFTSEIAD